MFTYLPVPYDSETHIPPTNYHLLAAEQEWIISRKKDEKKVQEE